MKLLFIKKKFNPSGGAERYLNLIIESFKKLKFSQALLTASWKEEKNLKIYSLKIYPWESPFFDYFFAKKAELWLKKQEKLFDLVISFDRTFSQHIYRASDGCHLKFLENRKRFLKEKLPLFLFPKHRMLLYLEKRCLESSQKIITNSFMVKREFTEVYGEKIGGKCEVLYNGINLKAFFPVSEEEKRKLRSFFGLPLDEEIILFMGSGYKRKGLSFLLKAFSFLKEGVLAIAGRERNLNFYKELSRKLRIERRCFFLGEEKNPERLYQVADLFVLPTLYDPFSNTVLEAMASGLPVITTKFNGAGEIIENGKEGFVLDSPQEEEELAVKMTLALSQKKEMGKRARLKAEKFAIEKKVREFIILIEKFLKERDRD